MTPYPFRCIGGPLDGRTLMLWRYAVLTSRGWRARYLKSITLSSPGRERYDRVLIRRQPMAPWQRVMLWEGVPR